MLYQCSQNYQEFVGVNFRFTVEFNNNTVEIRYNEILGTEKFSLLQVYIRYFVISVVNKQYKTKEINSLGPEKLVDYIRYFVILIRSPFIEFPLYI